MFIQPAPVTTKTRVVPVLAVCCRRQENLSGQTYVLLRWVEVSGAAWWSPSVPFSPWEVVSMGFEPVGLGLAVSSVPRGRAQTKRGVQICRGDSGLARTLITLSDWRSKSSPATLQAFIDLCVTSTREDSVDESPRGDCQSPISVAALKDASSAEAPADEAGWSARAPGQPVDESPRGDSMNGPRSEDPVYE